MFFRVRWNYAAKRIKKFLKKAKERMYVFNMTMKNQQTDENAGHFLNMRHAGKGVKMLCAKAKRHGWSP